MRKAQLISLIVISSLLAPSLSMAAVKAGNSCSKTGLQVTAAGVTYKCLQVGKKKIWSKVTVAVAPTPKATSKASPKPTSPSPIIISTPTPTPTPTPEPSPSASPTPAEPITFDDLIANPASAPYWAWKKSGAAISAGSAKAPQVVIHLGPNSKKITDNEEFAIKAVSNMYAGFSAPAAVHIIYYTFQDKAWAQKEFSQLAFRPHGGEAENSCQTITTCWGGEAQIDYKGNAILLIASGFIDLNHTSGTLEAHEYFHTVQGTQFIGSPKQESSYCCVKAYLPHWFVEGTAEYTQAASIYSNSFDGYLLERKHDAADILENRENIFDSAWMDKFLDLGSTAMWNDSAQRWRIYDVGFLVTEAFVALRGPGVVLQISKDVASGQSWESAFEKSFGTSWASAKPKLSAAIRAQLAR